MTDSLGNNVYQFNVSVDYFFGAMQSIADCMKAGLSERAAPDDNTRFLKACTDAAGKLGVEFWLDVGLSNNQAGMFIRSLVMARIDEIEDTIQVARSRGFLLPDSPFVRIETINKTRQIFVPLGFSAEEGNAMLEAARDLSTISVKYKSGEIRFDRQPAAQIASYEISVDGITPQSGDALTDILGYQPDGDFIKRKRAVDSLARLDFSKRKPYLLFTLEDPRGIVIAWTKMRDASGYLISRRDVFANITDADASFSNEDLTVSTNVLLEDDRIFQATTFYDWTTPEETFAVLDDSVLSDTLYSYEISAVQKKAPATPFIFDVPMNALLFSPALAKSARENVTNDAKKFRRPENEISPYPALAEAIYGDSGYGWIIAGCNMLASVRRGESADSVRSNSYVGATAEKLFADAAAGKVFVPSDITSVRTAVEAAITAYGISQTILSILDGTGLTHFISGKDDPSGIQATQQSIEGSTSGLARILSAIDPESATIDPNLLVISGKNKVGDGSTKSKQVKENAAATAMDELVGTAPIDLTTFSGIERFMELLRVVYDFYPGAFL